MGIIHRKGMDYVVQQHHCSSDSPVISSSIVLPAVALPLCAQYLHAAICRNSPVIKCSSLHSPLPHVCSIFLMLFIVHLAWPVFSIRYHSCAFAPIHSFIFHFKNFQYPLVFRCTSESQSLFFSVSLFRMPLFSSWAYSI